MNECPQIRKLRQELQRITDVYMGEAAERQIDLISELSVSYPHSIQLLSKAIAGHPETFCYNCHMFTFDLRDSEEVRQIATSDNAIYHPPGEFVAWLIETELIEITVSQARDGDFIIYFSQGRVKHSGVLQNGRIRSKWGTCHLWEHAIDEVPSDYGDEIRFYKKISRERCIAAFREYAKAKVDKRYGRESQLGRLRTT